MNKEPPKPPTEDDVLRRMFATPPDPKVAKKKMKAAQKLSPAEQSARFKETARALGADESPEAFERTLRRVAKPKAKPKS